MDEKGLRTAKRVHKDLQREGNEDYKTLVLGLECKATQA